MVSPEAPKPYLLLSDIHLHAWSAFATVGEDGINSRLRIILDAIQEAAVKLKYAGGRQFLIAGDLFHVRGHLSPTVLNPSIDLFDSLVGSQGMGLDGYAIPGNHDLESKDSRRLGNAITALEGLLRVINRETMFEASGQKVMMVPWHRSVADLFKTLQNVVDEGSVKDWDLVIHAPLDGVLPNIPPSGLTAGRLAKLGFKRVFVGHYHNYHDFGNGVYSIGALTHQTWADVGTTAGFLLVYPDRVEHHETIAPKFVDVGEEVEGDDCSIWTGNYVRMREEFNSAKEVDEARDEIGGWNPAGVTIHPSPFS